MDWQPISTAPRDGTTFIAKEGNTVFAAFYKPNKHPNAIVAETLQINWRRERYTAARGWFNPTHWMLLPAPPEDG